MAGCKNKRLIGPYIDGQLGDCPWLDEHIIECPECLAEFAAIREISHLAARADFAPPESSYWKNFTTRVSARIAAGKKPLFGRKRLAAILSASRPVRFFAAPATAIILAVLVSLTINYFYGRGFTSHNKPVNTQSQSASVLESRSKAITIKNAQSPDGVKTAAVTRNTQPRRIKSQNPAMANVPVPDNIFSGNKRPAGLEVKDLSVMLSRKDDNLKRKPAIGLSDAAFAELGRIEGFPTSSLAGFNIDIDKVITCQIMAGSGSSLVPTTLHREAANRYFTPRKSSAYGLIGQPQAGSWGYGTSGGKNPNYEKIEHLRLELKLSLEK